MPTVPFLGSYGDISGSGLMFRNKLINGGFDIWQRGTSQTSNGFGSDDRWNNGQNGSTKTASRQTFSLGQTDVPGNPKYWSRTVVTSVAGSTFFVYKSQPIESVNTFQGQTATLSFWAKADASKNIAVEFIQNFGSGGSPSSAVLGIGVTTFSLTTSWKYFTTTVSIPSITGKTLGTNNDDSFNIQFWFDAGSNFNARTNSLGQQSGTFDIANVQLEAGPVATPFEQRPIGTELALCQRYYYRATTSVAFSYFGMGQAKSTTSAACYVRYPITMRASPTTVETTNNAADYDVFYLNTATQLSAVPSYSIGDTNGMGLDVTVASGLTAGQFTFTRGKTTTAYLGFSAEL